MNNYHILYMTTYNIGHFYVKYYINLMSSFDYVTKVLV